LDHLLGSVDLEASECIGGGRIRQVQISVDGKLKKVESRGGLFGGDVWVVTHGLLRGCVLIPVWHNIVGFAAMRGGKYDIKYHDLKYLLHQVFGNVYDAVRHTYHVLHDTYGITFQHGEKGQLQKALQALEEHNIVAAGLSSANAHKVSGKFVALAKQILKQIGTSPRDEKKRQARDLTVQLATIFDSLDRINPGAKRAISVATMNRLRERTFNIRCIEPHIIARRMILKSIIEEMELYLLGIFDFLNVIFSPSNDPIQMLRTRATRESIVQQLGFYNQHLVHFDVEPFIRTAEHVHGEIDDALFYLKHNQYAEAVDVLRRSWNSLKLRTVRTELEDIILKLTFMLFKPVRVRRDSCDNLIFRTRKQMRMLQDVDETGFKHPVTDDAIKQLEIATAFLVQKTADGCQQAKEALKQAAGLL